MRRVKSVDIARLGVQDCTCFNFRKAARVVTRMYESTMRASGLKATQFSVLAMLCGGGPRNMLELAEVLAVERTTLSRNLGPLEQRGLVRVTEGKDRRTRQVMVTGKGEKAFQRALTDWQRAQNNIKKGLGARRWKQLLEDLRFTVDLYGEAR